MDEPQSLAEEIVGILYVAATFGFVLLFAWIRRFFAARVRRESQETIRAALQAGQALTPETVRAITAEEDSGRKDLRWGLTLIAIALAILVVALLAPVGPGEDDIPENFKWLVAAGSAFPGFLGVARLFLHFTRPKDID